MEMTSEAELAANDYTKIVQAVKDFTVAELYPGARIEHRPDKHYNVVVIFSDGSMLPMKMGKR